MSRLSLESQMRLGVDLLGLALVVDRARFDLRHSFPLPEEEAACDRVLVALDALLSVLVEVDGRPRQQVETQPFDF